MASDDNKTTTCGAAEFADLLFETFVMKRQSSFLGCVAEEDPGVNLEAFEKRKFGLLVSSVMLSFHYNQSPKHIVVVSLRQFVEKVVAHARKIWLEEAVQHELEEASIAYESCISQMLENGKSPLVWTSKMLQGVGVTVSNPATLVMIAHELLENFVGNVEAMKKIVLV